MEEGLLNRELQVSMNFHDDANYYKGCSQI